MTRILLALLAFYQRWLSPALHSLGAGGCKFMPTCSEYAVVAISTHGPMRGSGMALWRLLRCHPFTRGGFDPVPITLPSKGCFHETPEPPHAQFAKARPFPPEPLP